MKKYLVEGIGAFFWVLTLVLTLNNGAGSLAPLAIGAIVMVMTGVGASVSGAHFNPALSLAMLMRGKLDRIEFPYYVLAQLLGGFVAALIAVFLLGCGNAGSTNIQARFNDPICALLAEFIGAFLLVYTYLHIQRSEGQSTMTGLVVGGALLVALYAFGPVSGGAFNPAVGVGMIASGMAVWGDIWIYLLGSLLGGAAAFTAFQAIAEPEMP
ncbi:MAG: aquaporin [Saprospiraceae bacterium]|nr:aquaporin [Saprospiraceae bacterium]MCC7504131.1 aquaporin [Saprospiraceae bacterium]